MYILRRYTLVPRGNRFLFLDHFLFIAVVNKYHDNQVNLYVSSGEQGHRILPIASLLHTLAVIAAPFRQLACGSER